MKLTPFTTTLALATMLGSACGVVWGQIPRSGQPGNGGLYTTRRQADAAAQARADAEIRAKEKQAQAQADAKQAEWEAFRDAAVAKDRSERNEAITNLCARYSPVITDLESQVAALERKARDIEANNRVWVTNVVKPGPNHRVVNGQLYNTSDSKLWGSPIELAGGLPTLANNGHPIRYEVIAQLIWKNKVVCDIDAITYWFETWTGARQDEFRQTIKTIVIYNYPDPEKLVSGQAISCRCMRVANYNDNGISYEAYDRGVQATKDVAEVVPARPDAATVKKIEDNQNQLSAIKLKLSQVQRDFDKEMGKINLEALTEKNVEDNFAKYLKDKEDEQRRAAKKATQAKVVKWNQEQADKGDPTGLLRMGEFYRDGNGVPKDIDKAREYFTKASAAGSPDAADELSKLNRVSTNAPVNP
jgi:hypothetical protein